MRKNIDAVASAALTGQDSLACLVIALLLAACGGGSDSGSMTPSAGPAGGTASPSATCEAPPEGIQPPATEAAVAGGNITGATYPSFILIQPGNGARLLFYGPDLAASAALTGFVYAGSDPWCSGSDPKTYNGIDRGGNNEERVYLRTTVDSAGPSVSGSVRYPSATRSISGGPLPGSASATPAPLVVGDIQGTWSLTDRRGSSASLIVASDGTVSGTVNNCAFSGTVQVPAAGMLPLSLTLSRAPCNGTTLDMPYLGFALAYRLAGGGLQLLIWAEANNGVDFDNVLAIGRR
jgi:hypothetical protein